MSKQSFLLLGALFGFILSRAGATTYDFYPKLFLFEDLQLFWVISTAAILGAVGVAILKSLHARTLIDHHPIAFKPKPYRASLLPGSLVFGLGWGLAGACPGSALAMLGEGKLSSVFTLLGIFIGTHIYGAQQSRTIDYRK